MKKITSIIIATFSLMAMALISCKKDITLQEIEQESAGTISVSVDGLMGEYVQGDETRAGLVSTIRVSWTAGDKVYVYDGASCLGELTVSLKDGKDYYAVLTGENITTPQSGTTKLTLVYSNVTLSELNNSKVRVDISAQEGSTTPGDIPFVAYGTLDYTTGAPEVSGQIADFSLATSLMRLNCSGLEVYAAIPGAKLTGMSNECVLNITKDGVTIGQGSMGDIAVSLTDVSTSAKGTQTLYAAVARNRIETSQELEINQTKKYTHNFGSKAREAGKAFNVVCPMRGQHNIFFEAPFSVNANGKCVIFSKGNLWVDMSQGTEPILHFENNQYDFNENEYNSSHISHFIWSTTVEEASSLSGTYGGYLFCDEDHKISVDGSFEKYYVLSMDEWDYLLNTRIVNGGRGKDKSYSIGITYGGRIGMVLYPDKYADSVLSGSVETLPEGVVFLPLAGRRMGRFVDQANILGYYWSSTTIDEKFVFGIRIDNEHKFVGDYPCTGADESACIRLVSGQ